MALPLDSQQAPAAYPSAAAASNLARDSSARPASDQGPAAPLPGATAGAALKKSSLEEDAKDDAVAAAAAQAARLAAKKKRFLLAQAMRQKTVDTAQENSFKPKGDIHGVDCRQFSAFFRVLVDEGSETTDSNHDSQVVRAGWRQGGGAWGGGRWSSGHHESGIVSRLRALEEARIFRRNNLADLDQVVMAGLTKLKFWFPNSWDPASRFFTYEVCNPYTSDIEVILTVRGKYLEVVTTAEEHAHCWKRLRGPELTDPSSSQLPPAPRRVQQPDTGGPQSHLPYGDGAQTPGLTYEVLRYSVSIQKKRSICIFFKYVGAPELGAHGIPCRLPITSPSGQMEVRAMQKAAWSKCKVSVHCRETLLEILQLEIRPQPMIPTRFLRAYLGQGQQFTGLLPVEGHEAGRMVRVHSPVDAQNRLILMSADFVSKVKCNESADRLLKLAPVDSGSWLVHGAQPEHDALAFGAVRLCLDASGEIV